MASPSDLRVEAEDIDATHLYWTDVSGSVLPVDVYRSPNGSGYSLIDSVAAGVANYTDSSGLQPATKYWYRVTQDGGSTFSNVVTVVTHTCADTQAVAYSPFPEFTGDEQETEKINTMAEDIEAALGLTMFQGSSSPSPYDTCLGCVVDGAIVIDCKTGCVAFEFIIEEDVNSITIINCDDACPPIDFIIPPNQTWGICGWGGKCGYDGDECHDAPIPGGTGGRTGKTGGPSYGGYGGGHPGGPGRGKHKENCPCRGSTLHIVCCNPGGSCTPSCESDECIEFRVCGGKDPVTVETTKGVIGGGSGGIYNLCPETGGGSGLFPGQTAFIKQSICEFSAGATSCRKDSYDCDGNLLSQGDAGDQSCATELGLGSCTQGCLGSGTKARVSDPLVNCEHLPKVGSITACATSYPAGMCDKRTQEMIDGGCNPCPFSLNGAVVTATDAVGNSVSMTVG